MVLYIYHTVQIDCLQLCTFFYNCFLLQLFSSIENREKTGRRCGIGSARSGRKAAAAIRGPAPSPCVIAIPVHFPRCFPHVRSLPSTNQERLWTVKLVSIGGEGGGRNCTPLTGPQNPFHWSFSLMIDEYSLSLSRQPEFTKIDALVRCWNSDIEKMK